MVHNGDKYPFDPISTPSAPQTTRYIVKETLYMEIHSEIMTKRYNYSDENH